MWRGLIAALAALALVPVQAEAQAEADKSSNAQLVERFPYGAGDGAFWAGSDIDFRGRYAYGAQLGRRGGVHIFDVAGKKPRQIAFVPCPGYQNDIAVVKPGLIALGFHDSRCSRARSGIQLIDVRNPRTPRMLGAVKIPDGGTHTLTVYPGKPLIYSSPGGSGSPETIVDVADPRDPKIVESFLPGPRVGCHDVAFHFDGSRKLGICAGDSATQIWDVSDPLAPKVLGEVINPAMWFHHSAAVTPDGKNLVIGDEGFGACVGASFPAGAIWIYDIRDPSLPTPVGYFGVHRERPTVCTAHNFNFIPGSRYLVSSWYLGGMNVIDLSDPANPKEVAHYAKEGTDYWSAYWYRGRIYASGVPGFDVFKIRGLP